MCESIKNQDRHIGGSNIYFILLTGKQFYTTGDDRARTDHFMLAKHAFYQLNYTPFSDNSLYHFVCKISPCLASVRTLFSLPVYTVLCMPGSPSEATLLFATLPAYLSKGEKMAIPIMPCSLRAGLRKCKFEK